MAFLSDSAVHCKNHGTHERVRCSRADVEEDVTLMDEVGEESRQLLAGNQFDNKESNGSSKWRKPFSCRIADLQLKHGIFKVKRAHVLAIMFVVTIVMFVVITWQSKEGDTATSNKLKSGQITSTAPPSIAPTTMVSPTMAPTTMAPTSHPPTTVPPTSIAPTTIAPMTTAPTQVLSFLPTLHENTPLSPAYVNPNDQPFDPPDWIKPYIEFHNSQVQQSTNMLRSAETRWIKWYCPRNERTHGNRHCGGLGDRLKGIIQSMLFGVISNRVTLVQEWGTPQHPLLWYLEPNLINYAAKHTKTPKSNITDVLGFAARREKDAIFYAIHEKPCNFELPKYGTQNYTGVRYTGNYYTKQSILQTASCMKKMWKSKTKDYNIVSTLFWTLFRFAPRVRDEADRLRGPIRMRNYYIAAHIRTGNGTSWSDPLNHNTADSWDIFSDCIRIFQDALEARCKGHRPMAYLASDNQEAKDYVQAMHPLGAVHAPEVEIYHIDRTKTNLLENTTAAYDAVMAEFKILMDSTCLIMSDSGFSFLAKDFSRVQHRRCAIKHTDCADPERVEKALRFVECPW